MFSKELFGKRILEARKKANENQEILSKLLDVNKSHISEMETGKKTTTPEKITLICRHYHISADYLLGLTDDPTPYGWKEEEDDPPAPEG